MDARIAESNTFNGTVMGTRMFCHTFGGVGYKVCQAAFDELTPITPGESDGIKESTCYIEVGFHDNPTEAALIIGNTGAVAEKCQ